MTSSASASTPWIVTLAPNPSARLRLLCCPYAGGGASTFLPWARLLPRDVELCAVQMPGREERLDEPPITRLDLAVDRVAEQVIPRMDRPFALFGHSVGAALAFELARRLRRDGRRGLVHLFVSGRQAPHVPSVDPPIHQLPDDEFVQHLRALAGTPEEVVQSAEMMAIFLPVLRADFCLAETYTCRSEPPLDVPTSAYGGTEDEHVPTAALDAWREHTTSSFRRVMFPGGHFFLDEKRPALLSELTRDLLSATRQGAC